MSDTVGVVRPLAPSDRPRRPGEGPASVLSDMARAAAGRSRQVLTRLLGLDLGAIGRDRARPERGSGAKVADVLSMATLDQLLGAHVIRPPEGMVSLAQTEGGAMSLPQRGPVESAADAVGTVLDGGRISVTRVEGGHPDVRRMVEHLERSLAGPATANLTVGEGAFTAHAATRITADLMVLPLEGARHWQITLGDERLMDAPLLPGDAQYAPAGSYVESAPAGERSLHLELWSERATWRHLDGTPDEIGDALPPPWSGVATAPTAAEVAAGHDRYLAQLPTRPGGRFSFAYRVLVDHQWRDVWLRPLLPAGLFVEPVEPEVWRLFANGRAVDVHEHLLPVLAGALGGAPVPVGRLEHRCAHAGCAEALAGAMAGAGWIEIGAAQEVRSAWE